MKSNSKKLAQKKSILIIDDHSLFREGLKAIIEREPGFSVVGEARDGSCGIELAKELKPDLIIVDISLPDESGIELTRKLVSLLPNTLIMIVSMHSSINYIKNAFRAGASGYIVKESTSEQLIRGLNSMTKDDYFLDSSVSHQVIDELIEYPDKETKIIDSLYETLSPREQEIFRLLAEGLTSKEIANKLFISPKTADNHRSSINYKLGLQGTVELIRYAVKLGLIDVESWKD